MIALFEIALAAASSTAAAAAPGACVDAALFDPVTLGFGEGPLAPARRACPRDELTVGAGSALIAEVEEFYGNLRARGTFSIAVAFEGGRELYAALELVRYQAVISSISADHFGLGHLAFGGTQRVGTEGGSTLALAAHATLPTAVGLYSRTYPLALEAGAAASTRVDAELELHAYLGANVSAGIGAGPPDPRAGLLLEVGAGYRFFDSFALVADLEGAAGHRAVLDHAAIGLGVRFAAAPGLTLELLLKAPVAGDERTLVTGYLGVAYWE